MPIPESHSQSPRAASLAVAACAAILLLQPSGAAAQGLPDRETGRPAGDAATTATVAAPALSLPQALSEAAQRSEEALLLKEQETHVAARKREAWAEGLPRIMASANAGRGNQVMDPAMYSKLGSSGDTAASGKTAAGSADAISFSQTRYYYGIEAQQVLYSFGRLGTVVRAASTQEEAEALGRRRSMHELHLRTLDAYYGLVTARARLGTLEASVKRNSETVAFLESNWKMGSGMRANVLRAITALKSLEPERIRAERDAEAARMHLNRLLGRPIEAPVELDTATSLPMDPVAAEPDPEMVKSAVDARPDIRNLSLARRSHLGRARYLKMLYLPTLGATGKIGVVAYDVDQLGEFSNNKEWQYGIGLTWNLYDGGTLNAQANQRYSEARQMRLSEQIARKMAQVEIESAYRDHRAADTALAAAEQAVQAAREAQAMLSEDFRAGKGQITDLLGTEEALRQAEFGVLNARYQKVRSQATLRLALGRGLINEEAP